MSKEVFEDKYWLAHEQKLEVRHKLALERVKHARSILDVGCGSGTFLLHCPAKMKWGLELSKVAVAKCASLGVQAVHFDFEKKSLPYDSGAFDVVTALDVLEHTFDPVSQLIKFAECGKKVVITVPNFATLPSRISAVLGLVPQVLNERKGHCFYFTYSKCKEVFNRAGLEITHENHYYLMDNRLIGLFTHHFFKLFPNLFATEFCFELVKKGEKVKGRVDDLSKL